jgi:hypothetical protein
MTSDIAIRVENCILSAVEGLGKLYRIGGPSMQLVGASGEDECGF